MNIACATDNNFVQHCGVMLTSLFENNKDCEKPIHIYLLTEGLSDKNKGSLKKIAEKYDAELHYCVIDKKYFENCPIKKNDRLNIVTYYRYLLPDILPVSENKLLYLDCDIIIRQSLKELWNTNIENYALAAVDETIYSNFTERFERLQYSSKYKYFNAGVLLINLDFWRKNNIAAALFDYTNKNADILKFHDQDVLNAVLHKNWLAINCKWNVTEDFYQEWIYTKMPEDIRKIIHNPAVLHYTCLPKPWQTGSYHPLRKEYFKYLNSTEWENFKVPFVLIKWIKFNIIRKIFVSLGLRKNRKTIKI